MSIFINSVPDHIKIYLNQHRIEGKDFDTYNNLKSAVIGSYFKMTRFKNNYFFVGNIVKDIKELIT